jgi:hypothetical protein
VRLNGSPDDLRRRSDALTEAMAVLEKGLAHKPLPGPNVVVARAGTPLGQLSPEAVKGILVNQIYTGAGPFSRLVES